MRSIVVAGSVGLVGALLTAACADSSRSLNPTAPSSIAAGQQVLAAGGDDQAVAGATGGKGKPDNPGNGNGGGKPDNPGNGKPEDPGKPDNPGRPEAPGNSGQPGNPHTPTPPADNITPPAPGNTTPSKPGNPTPPGHIQNKVEIQGVIGAIDGSTITVNGQIVTVPSGAVIRQGHTQYAFSELLVGDPVHVRATRTVAGTGPTSTVSIEAVEVKLQREDEDDDEEEEDEDEPTLLVSVGALDGTAAEAGLDAGTFRFSRSGVTTAELTVAILVSGTATNGTDFQSIALTVTFAAGQATADVVVMPLADALAEGSETVIVTVVAGEGYDTGSPASATVTIAG